MKRTNPTSRDREGAAAAPVNTTPLEAVSAGRGSTGSRTSRPGGAVAGAPGGSRARSAAGRDPLFSRAARVRWRARLPIRFQQEEAIGQQDHRRVVVEPPPTPPLEV